MQHLTSVGQNIINDISRRYNLSFDSTVNMLVAVNNGGGSMAQFSCPEYGSGQWMSGGMTMVGDMFNYGLKNTVNNICAELSNALANNQIFQPLEQGPLGSSNWWPSEFGSPASSGSQNDTRYAFFPQSQRLAVEQAGNIKIFDTLDHNISGVSQQQGGNTSLTFSSQYGTISTLSLPLVSGENTQAPDTNNFVEEVLPSEQKEELDSESSKTLALLESLGELLDSGVLTKDEFDSKKTELLKRL